MALCHVLVHSSFMTPDQWFDIAEQAIGVVLAAGLAEWVRAKVRQRADRKTDGPEQDSED